MDLDETFFLKEEDDSQPREEEQKIAKQNLEFYKKTISLLKTKMIKSDVLISQYNDKIKECDLLIGELSTVKAEKQNVLNKCNVLMEKVTRMELTNKDCKQSIDKYKRLSEEQKLKLDENRILFSQYDFKIKNLDKEKSELEDNVKMLQENLKSLKAKNNEKKQTKHKNSQTLRIEKRDFSGNTDIISFKPEKCDFSVNTDFPLFGSEKPLMENKIVMTDEILRTEPFPIFCTKCEILIKPPPVNQILRIMSSSPPLLSDQISPPNSPDKHNEDDITQAHYYDQKSKHVGKPIVQVPQKIDKFSFMELVKRVGKLESLVNKKKMKTEKSSCINNRCCDSNNINLVVKVPPETKVHEYRKREKRKSKAVKRLKTKPFKIDKHQYLDNDNWTVENCIEFVNQKAIVQAKEKVFKKRKAMSRKKEIDSLFESPERVIPEEKMNSPSPPLSSESLSPTHKTSSPSQESLPSSKSFLDETKTSKLGLKKQLFVQNVNIENSVVESDVDISLSCTSLSSQLSVEESINKIMKKKARNSNFNKKVCVTNKSAEVKINDENRHQLLSNEVEMRQISLPVENIKDKTTSNEDICVKQHGVHNLLEENKNNGSVNQVSSLANESINNGQINKPTQTLVSPLKTEENNLLQSPKHTDNIERHDEINIFKCKKNLHFNTSIHQSNETSVDSNVTIEAEALSTSNTPFACINKDKQEENVCSEEDEKDFTESILTKQVTEPCNISNVKIIEHSPTNMPEIKIDDLLSVLEKDASLSEESLTNSHVENPENTLTKDTILLNENLTNEFVQSRKNSTSIETSLSNETLTNKFIESFDNSICVRNTILPNKRLTSELVENPENNAFTKDISLQNEISAKEFVESQENNTVTDASLPIETSTNKLFENSVTSSFTKGESLPKESSTNELVKSPERCDETNDLISNEVPKHSPQKESELYQSILLEKTAEYATENTHKILLTVLTQNSDEKSSSNIIITTPENSANPEEPESIDNVPLLETQVVRKTQKTDEAFTLECTTQNTQENLLDILKQNSDEGNASNILSTLTENLASPEEFESVDDIALMETQVVAEFTKMDEALECATQNIEENLLDIFGKNSDEESSSNVLTPVLEKSANLKELEPVDDSLPTELHDLVSEARVTQSPLIKQVQKEDAFSNENKLEVNAFNLDENLQNSHTLPITPTIGRNKKVNAPAIEKCQETTSPNLQFTDYVNSDSSLSPIVRVMKSKSIRTIDDTSNSSSESSETRCFSQSGNKRDLANRVRNVIFSDESSEDSKLEPFSVERQPSMSSGKEVSSIMTSITHLKKVCHDPTPLQVLSPSLPKHLPIQAESIRQFSSVELNSVSNSTTLTPNTKDAEPEFSYVPCKKRRIAHNPKNVKPNISSEKQESSQIIKKRKTTTKPKAQSNDKVSEILEVFDKTCKERQEIYQKLKPQPPDVFFRSNLGNINTKIQDHNKSSENMLIQPPLKKPRGRPPKKKPTINIASEISTTMEEGKQDAIIPLVPPPKKVPKKTVPIKLTNVCKNSEESININSSKSELEEGELCDSMPSLDISIKNASVEEEKLNNSILTLSSSSDVEKISVQGETQLTESEICGRKKDVLSCSADNESPIRELRSRQVGVSQKLLQATPKATRKTMSSAGLNDTKAFSQQIDETNSCLRESTIISFLNKYLADKSKLSNTIPKTRKQNEELKKNEAFCQEQLEILIKTEEWTTELNSEVTKKLLSSGQELKTIALSLVDYAAEKCSEEEPLNKCNTPPAPMMTRSEQKLVTLIDTITQTHAEFNVMIERGLEFKLFRPGSRLDVQMVERLFRILVVLNKIKKDREKVRMLCCDALYCLGVHAINTIYVALTCWSEVFPKHDSNNDVIVKTIVHIVMNLQVQKRYPKLNSLKMLLSKYYGYPDAGYMTDAFKIELIKNLQENAPGINTAVLLLCKRLGHDWTSKNIIEALKQMLVDQSHPSVYEALCLLGDLLCSFPANDPKKTVTKAIDQLCDVLNVSVEGSDNVQEGIVSCLLSISKFKFEQIARSVIRWQFHKELRSTTKIKLITFFNRYNPKWWWKFVQSNFPLSLEE